MDFNNNSNVIDSRDVIARIEELVALRDANIEAMESFGDDDCEDFTKEDAEELAALEALALEGSTLEDWSYGAVLIHDGYFEDYAQTLAEEVCDLSSASSWPTSHIDWKSAAAALQSDYTSIEFDGTTYWVR